MTKEISAQFAQVERVVMENRDPGMICAEISKLQLMVTAEFESAAQSAAHLEVKLAEADIVPTPDVNEIPEELKVVSVDEAGEVTEAPLVEETPVEEAPKKRRR